MAVEPVDSQLVQRRRHARVYCAFWQIAEHCGPLRQDLNVRNLPLVEPLSS